LLEKRAYSVANLFLFSLFVGSFRRFLEWTAGGVPEPFPLSFIVTLTGFYWLAFFLITLILRTLVAQPWRVSINVILVGVFLGVFPPIIDVLVTGPGFEYAYVWSLPAQFHWYLYNPALKIPAGEAAVLWAVILLTALYVWHRTQSPWRAAVALVWAYASVLVLGGVIAGVAKYLRLAMGWEPTQQIALVNLMQVLAAFAIYLLLQPRLAGALARRVPAVLPYLALYFLGAWAAGAAASPASLVYALLLAVLLLGWGGAGDGCDAEDARFLALTGALLLTALAAANAFALLPLALVYLAGLLERGGEPRGPLLAAATASAAFAAGVTAAAEQAAYGAPRWWISFLPAPADAAAVGPLRGLPLALTAGVAAGALLVFSVRRRAAPAEPGYAAFGVLGLTAFVALVRLYLDWALTGAYPTRMLMTFLLAAGRYGLAVFAFAAVAAQAAGVPWRELLRRHGALVWLGAVPPLIDVVAGAGGSAIDFRWAPPAAWSAALYYPAQGIAAGEAVLWWALVLGTAGAVWALTKSAARTAAALTAAYAVASAVSIGPAWAADTVREALGWPHEHRLMIMAVIQVAALFAVYLALQPALRRGLLGRLPHVLPFVLIVFLGAAFQGGAVTVTAVAYAFLLLFAGWIALGQNDYFDAADDAAQGRATYLDLEDVRLLTVISWLGVAGLAAAHSAATFPAAMAAATYMLYNYPFYRGKRYFPTNLKIEGVWGFCAFVFGVVAAFEHGAYGGPRWWYQHSPPLPEAYAGPLPGSTLAAMLLAFGGFSLVASLKDYKDTEADLAAGVQTLYTVALKRGRSLARVHAVALGVCCAAVASAPFLMAAAGKTAWWTGVGGLAAAAAVWRGMRGAPSAAGFRRVLVILALYFGFLIAALVFAPGA
jgi:hypothetical protein